jgi:APA family basic amino acid/polyamine antiporter
MLEYLVGAATVAVGWSGYLVNLQGAINLVSGSTYKFDGRFVNAPVIWLEHNAAMPWDKNDIAVSGGFLIKHNILGFFLNKVIGPDGALTNAIINLPAIIITLALTVLLFY